MYDTVLSRLHETAQQSRIGASDRSIGMTFQRHIDGDLLASIQLFEGLVAIVCAQVAFLQFFEGGIDGVAAGASIVECPFRHVVNDIQECLFVNAPILNGLRNVNSLLQIFSSLDQFAKVSSSSLPLKPQYSASST